MSYHVSIIRTNAGRPEPIAQEEVVKAIANDKAFAIVEKQDELMEIELVDKAGAGKVLVWQDGEIWTKNPDPETLQAMLELAKLLKARVRGDEFETYRTVDDTFIHPDDKPALARAQAATSDVVRTTRKRKWLMNSAIIAFFFLAAALVTYCGQR